jgi:hypothetical protein
MKRKKTIYAVLLVVACLAFFAIAATSQAQTTTIGKDLVPCSGTACKWCDVFALLQNVFNTATFLLFPVVIVFIMYGGVLYIIGGTAGSDKQIKRAKDIVSDAITGLIIVLLSFVIVNALVVGITGAKIENFLQIDCQSINFPTEPVIPPPPPPGGGGTGDGDNTDQAKRDELKDNGISVNKDDCPAGVPYQNVEGGCTSLDNVGQDAINGIIDFNAKCDAAVPGGCNVVVTGGSEGGHSGTGPGTHAGGDKLDISATPEVTGFIESNFTPMPPRGDGATQYKDPATGVVYALEPGNATQGPHWDITFP